MKLLVATRNNDKFAITKRLFHAVDSSVKLESLKDTSLTGEVEEVGTIEERALQKARYFVEAAKKQLSNIPWDGVLGIDDGIDLGDGQVRANSHETTDLILSGQAIPVGNTVRMARASTIIWFADGSESSSTAYLLFTFIGNPKNIVHREGIYPLSYVLAPLGQKNPLSELTEDVTDQCYLRYSQASIETLLNSDPNK